MEVVGINANGVKIKAHGYYKYNGDKYVILTSETQLPYMDLKGWIPLFDTEYGSYISEELLSSWESYVNRVGRHIFSYWYLVPSESVISREFELLGSDRQWHKMFPFQFPCSCS